MSRDLFKTIGGVVIIGGIVVATFLYGNRQRQNQIKADRQAQEQQDRRAEAAKEETSQPVAATSPPAQPAANPPAEQQAAAQPAQTPETGSELLYLAPGVAIVMLYRAKRASVAAVRTALLA